ncbi:hypothetical protein [Pseudenhygromyxa sp. WMMC2535]|uniref:hypothetical protein n=1 Tax=Pseudenhygromyxa sp. WMMC2535 TaxID=2712867 RepID=UPI0031F80A88
MADLETLSITLSDGSRVPLGSLAYVDQARSYGKVSRREGMRTVTVTGGLRAAHGPRAAPGSP